MRARDVHGGLYKLIATNVTKRKSNYEINLLDDSNMTRLYHERFGHQNKAHVKKVIEKELCIKLKSETESKPHASQNSELNSWALAHRQKFGTRKQAKCPEEHKLSWAFHTEVCGPFLYSCAKYRCSCYLKMTPLHFAKSILRAKKKRYVRNLSICWWSYCERNNQWQRGWIWHWKVW